MTKHINNSMITTHKHHIIPKHIGGPDSDDNLIELTVEEHAEARSLYEQYGRTQDKVAWLGLAKLAPHAELIRILQSEGMQGDKNPLFGKPAPNRGTKRPGVGGRKAGTKWSEAERNAQKIARSKSGHYDYLKDPARGAKISKSQQGRKGAAKGKTWFTDDIVEIYADKCPTGFVKGRKPGRQSNKTGLLWFNDGTNNRQFKDGEQPEGYVRGRITKK